MGDSSKIVRTRSRRNSNGFISSLGYVQTSKRMIKNHNLLANDRRKMQVVLWDVEIGCKLDLADQSEFDSSWGVNIDWESLN